MHCMCKSTISNLLNFIRFYKHSRFSILKGLIILTDWNKIDKFAKEWLQEARSKIIASFESTLTITTKSDANDLVTNMDEEIENFFVTNIRNQFPSHEILGEESIGHEIEQLDGVVWIIDPIDGTMNFVHQKRNFFISIGIYEDGVGQLGYLYDVVHNELYYGKKGEGVHCNEVKIPPIKDVPIHEAIVGISATWLIENKDTNKGEALIELVKDVRGTRSYGSAALEFSYVATGRLDAYISMRLAPWDFAGGKIIIEELGGIVTDLDGKALNLLEKSPVLVTSSGLHEQIFKSYIKK